MTPGTPHRLPRPLASRSVTRGGGGTSGSVILVLVDRDFAREPLIVMATQVSAASRCKGSHTPLRSSLRAAASRQMPSGASVRPMGSAGTSDSPRSPPMRSAQHALSLHVRSKHHAARTSPFTPMTPSDVQFHHRDRGAGTEADRTTSRQRPWMQAERGLVGRPSRDGSAPR